MCRFTFVVALSLCLSGLPAGALAQARPERPYRGLFGGGAPSDLGQSLAVSLSLGTGWNDNRRTDGRSVESLRPDDFNTTRRGLTGNATAALTYGLNLGRVNLAATAGTDARYYQNLNRNLFRRDYVHGNVSIGLLAGVTAFGTVTYAPYNLGSVFGQPASDDGVDGLDSVAPDSDLASSTAHFVSYGGGVRLAQSIPVSRRGSISGAYRVHRRESNSEGAFFFPDDTEDFSSRLRNYRGHTARISYTHRLTQSLSLRAGYRLDQAWYGESEDGTTLQTIDAGLMFSRSLSFSRRTSVSFRTGTVLADNPSGIGNPRLGVTGRANLTHELGRTWDASLLYGRGVTLSEAWPEPVTYDTIVARLGGLLSRRINVSASARTARGHSGLSDSASSSFDWVVVGANLGYALSRFASLNVRYSYYVHDFENTALLAPGVPAGVGRHGAGVHLTLWAPLIQRARTNHVAR